MDSIAHLDKLANVPEIFEEVFFQLPFLDLVIATGVNHTWRDFIYNSAKLQRKLFRSPSKALVGEPYVDKHGVLGRRMNQKECLNDDNNMWTAELCPFLLAPKYDHHSAYLTERAAQATFWPYMYLTNPPCAHARVSFTYKGILENGTLVIVEGARSLYRPDGVTIVAIEEALYQPGAAQVKKVVRNGQHMPEVVWTKQQYNTTLLEEIAACEENFNCKLDIDLAETWIRLHCSTSEPAGTLRVVIPYRFSHMRYALPARKILFDE